MRRPVLLVALLVAPLLAAGVAASPQPVAVCGICGDRLERIDPDRNLSVGHTTVTIEVDAAGTADWRLTGELVNASASAYYRAQPDELEDATRVALTESTGERPPADSVTNVDARVTNDGTLVVRFTQADFAEQRFGGVLVSGFLVEDSSAGVSMSADRLDVVPPDGYEFTNAPTGAERLPHRAVWHRDEFRQTALVMAPENDAAAALATRVVLARRAAPNVLLSIGLVLPGALLLVPLAREAGRLAGRLPRHPRGPELVAGGGAFAFVLGLPEPTWPLLALGGVGIVAGVVARFAPLRERLDRPIHWAAVVGSVLAAVALAFGAVAPLWVWPGTGAFWRGLVWAAFALPAALLLPYGIALESGEGRRWRYLTAAALLVVPLAFSDPTAPTGTFGGLFALIVMAGAVVSAALGVPLCWLGRHYLAPTGGPAPGSP